jgi:Domain of unknown function (DUF222)
MYEQVVRVRGQLAELVTAIDPDAVSGATARQLWAEFDQVERLGAAGKMLLARRVAATHSPARQGTKTAAEELARTAGTSTGVAQDSVETSHRLPEQPTVQHALRGGELSPAQAALISSAAAANPAKEARLVELASQLSMGELREECARVKAAAEPDPDATNRRLHAARQLRQWTDGEGFWTLHAKGTPQAGAIFTTALQPIIDQLFTAAYRAGRREPVQAHAFDALIHLVEHATGHCSCHLAAGNPDDDPPAGPTSDANDGADGADGPDRSATAADPGQSPAGDPAATVSGVDPVAQPAEPAGVTGAGRPEMVAAGVPAWSVCGVRPRASVNPRYLALLRVDVEALRRGSVTGGELCEIAGVGPVPVTVARGLLGDAIVKLVITDGVDVLNVTHLGRVPTAAQKAALLWMNPTC